jgi:hypothetical protein
MTTESDRPILREEEIVGVNAAKEEVKKLIDGYNESRSHEPDYESVLREQTSNNSKYQQWCTMAISRQTVSTLLPTETMFNFSRILNPLFMNEGVGVTRDLANLPEANIKSMPGVGTMEKTLFLAMRRLAIAQLRAQAPNNPQV